MNKKEGLDAIEISPQFRAEAIKAAGILAGRATLTVAAEYFMKHSASSNEVTVQVFEKYRDYQKAEGLRHSTFTPGYHSIQCGTHLQDF